MKVCPKPGYILPIGSCFCPSKDITFDGLLLMFPVFLAPSPFVLCFNPREQSIVPPGMTYFLGSMR